MPAVPRKRPAGASLALTPATDPSGIQNAASKRLLRATMVSGRGLTLPGGFLQTVLRLGVGHISGLSVDGSRLIVEETHPDRPARRISLPLDIVALEYE